MPTFTNIRFIALWIGLLSGFSFFAQAKTSHLLSVLVVPDEEYDRYRREGDDLFDKGEYDRAIKKYNACLAVPKYENDVYAINRIKLCNKLAKLRKEGEKALAQNKGAEAVRAFKEVLEENPKDPIAQKNLADYWESEGKKLEQEKKWEEAQKRYEEALNYTIKKETALMLIENCKGKLIEEDRKKYALWIEEADRFFEKGNYEKALELYQHILTLKTFANDKNIANKITLCHEASRLRKDVDSDLQYAQPPNTVLAKLERLLEINPKDVLVKEQLTNYWQAKANYVYERGNYKEAKKRLENALKYTDDDKMKTLIQKAFESCNEKINRGEDKPYLSDTPPPTIPTKDTVDRIPRTHHFVLPKIAVAATGICAGIYALVINSTWNSKLNALTVADKVGDPTNSGFMASSGSYTTYKAAYDDAKNYQSKQALRNACVGIAIGAALVETYLFIKPKPAPNAFRISPASQSVGLALQYKF